VAVVVRVNAADGYRPQVRVVIDARGERLPRPYEIALWEQPPGCGRPAAVVAPLDPGDFGLDQRALF
jgi:hypothetical protein